MDRDRILLILREHAPELKAAGLVHLRVFGSVARGEASPQSDVDLMADFDKSKPNWQLSGNCRSFPRPPAGSRIMERGCALGSIGKGCAEWATY